jgi:hypothetical protein
MSFFKKLEKMTIRIPHQMIYHSPAWVKDKLQQKEEAVLLAMEKL